MKLILYSLITLLLCKDALAVDEKAAPTKTLLAFHHLSRFHIDSLRRPFYALEKHTDFQKSYLSISGSDHQKKSAFFALSMSAILPGTGQLYAQNGRESLIKGASFLALEITGWVLYFHNQNKGKKFEKKYEKFADNHWDVDKYLLFLETSLQNDPNFEISPGDLGRKDSGINFALLESAENEWGTNTGVSVHHLYKNSRQQYYEMIYKYPEQFGLGWSDAINNQNTYPYTGYTRNNLTPLMIDYRGMRIKSNDYLSTARGMTGLIMINHLLSITDAVWTVKRKNREESTKLSLSFRLEQKQHQNELITFSTIRFIY
ncbi:hypothetical protein F9K33_01325 [bacterium]|nr:MAG: hypothetical protein F9K33_01325 [bacterium]